jgi:tetratricopeptide (TPR) repeat protein
VYPGSHEVTATATGDYRETVRFELSPGVIERYLSKPLYVVNPGGAAVVLYQKMIYGKDPKLEGLAGYRLYHSETFMTVDAVDYAFREFPDEITLSQGQSWTLKSGVSVYAEDPSVVLNVFPPNTPAEERMDFAEHQLRLSPRNGALAWGYTGLASKAGLCNRARSFLELGLELTPISVEWHRCYQHVCRLTGREDELDPLYDRLCAENPDNACVLYLKAQSCVDAARYLDLCEKATTLDPDNPYPWHGKGVHLNSVGRFEEAAPALERACELAPDDWEFRTERFCAWRALGRYDELEAELRQVLHDDPTHFATHLDLLCVLHRQGKPVEMRRAHDRHVHACRRTWGEDDRTGEYYSRAWQAYLAGDVRRAVRQLKELPDDEVETRTWRFLMYAELGDFSAAGTLHDRLPRADAAYRCMILACAALPTGTDTRRRDKWYARAIDALEAGCRAERLTAKLLRDPERATVEKINAIRMARAWRTVLLVLVAPGSPAEREAMCSLAARLNCDDDPPHGLLEHAIEQLRGQSSPARLKS